ncbi:hypothetical protein CIW48_20185 [Methylobacterium sp. P1-11]|nr:hypothetical protein CIW48_20185 [Methylobacterium sp. P1-11]
MAEISSMGDVFRFPGLAAAGGQLTARALDRAALRAELEEAAREAMDTAERIIAALDRFDDDAGVSNPRDGAAPVVWFPRSSAASSEQG